MAKTRQITPGTLDQIIRNAGLEGEKATKYRHWFVDFLGGRKSIPFDEYVAAGESAENLYHGQALPEIKRAAQPQPPAGDIPDSTGRLGETLHSVDEIFADMKTVPVYTDHIRDPSLYPYDDWRMDMAAIKGHFVKSGNTLVRQDVIEKRDKLAQRAGAGEDYSLVRAELFPGVDFGVAEEQSEGEAGKSSLEDAIAELAEAEALALTADGSYKLTNDLYAKALAACGFEESPETKTSHNVFAVLYRTFRKEGKEVDGEPVIEPATWEQFKALVRDDVNGENIESLLLNKYDLLNPIAIKVHIIKDAESMKKSRVSAYVIDLPTGEKGHGYKEETAQKEFKKRLVAKIDGENTSRAKKGKQPIPVPTEDWLNEQALVLTTQRTHVTMAKQENEEDTPILVVPEDSVNRFVGEMYNTYLKQNSIQQDTPPGAWAPVLGPTAAPPAANMPLPMPGYEQPKKTMVAIDEAIKLVMDQYIAPQDIEMSSKKGEKRTVKLWMTMDKKKDVAALISKFFQEGKKRVREACLEDIFRGLSKKGIDNKGLVRVTLEGDELLDNIYIASGMDSGAAFKQRDAIKNLYSRLKNPKSTLQIAKLTEYAHRLHMFGAVALDDQLREMLRDEDEVGGPKRAKDIAAKYEKDEGPGYLSRAAGAVGYAIAYIFTLGRYGRKAAEKKPADEKQKPKTPAYKGKKPADTGRTGKLGQPGAADTLEPQQPKLPEGCQPTLDTLFADVAIEYVNQETNVPMEAYQIKNMFEDTCTLPVAKADFNMAAGGRVVVGLDTFENSQCYWKLATKGAGGEEA